MLVDDKYLLLESTELIDPRARVSQLALACISLERLLLVLVSVYMVSVYMDEASKFWLVLGLDLVSVLNCCHFDWL